MNKLRLCFAGTPDFAAKHLQALLESSHDVIAVYTQPDRPAGRGKKLLPSPVKQLAEAHAIPLRQPVSLKSTDEQQQLRDLAPDLLVVVAYGLILPQAVLDIPRFGCINVHASILPRWRGAAPIERALLAGDKVTGVTIMQMDAGLDTGDMLAIEEVAISDNDTRVDLENKLAAAGPKGLLRVLADLDNMQKNAVKQQDSLSTYAAKLDKSEALIHWDMPAERINRQVRVGIGRTPAWCYLGNQRLRILAASPRPEQHASKPGTILDTAKDSFTVACQQSVLSVLSVQLPGKNAMGVGDVLNSKPELFQPGTVLSHIDPAGA